MHPWRSQSGQSTIEYAGAVLLVCALLGGLALLPFDGRSIAGALTHQLAYALCVVARGDCDQDRQPCATGSDDRSFEWSLRVLVLKAGRHHLLVREDHSDGTVSLSLVENAKGGLDASTGFSAHLSLGRSGFALGGELSAAVLAQVGSGSTWVLPKAKADRLQRLLVAHFATASVGDLLPTAHLADSLLPGLPRPAQTFGEKGLSASIGASLGGDAASAGLRLYRDDTFGTRLDERTGRRTYYVKRNGRIDGSLEVSALGDASASAGHASEYALTVDREGVPIDLAVIETGTLKGSATLSGPLGKGESAHLGRDLRASASASGERRWVSESHLDLTDSTNRAAAGRFIAQVTSPRLRAGAAMAVSKELSRLLAEQAVINLRTYDIDAAEYGAGAEGSIEGIAAGGELKYSTETSTLVAARTRGIDGQWRTRGDCLAAARTGRAQRPTF